MSNCTPLPVIFNSEVKLDRFFSCERQDEFVYHLLAKHLDEPGFFLDIACATPLDASNTYVLEKYFNWNGIGFDVGNIEKDHNWSAHRSSEFIQIDVTSRTFTRLLKHRIGNKVVDYISLDVDSGDINYAVETLKRIMDSGVFFKVMTLEHELNKHGLSVAGPTREILESAGYKMLFKNVTFLDGSPWEDWWINPELMPYNDIMKISCEGLVYNECVERVKNFNWSKK